MGFTDVILFPIYVLLFHLFFKRRRKQIEDPILKKYHRWGFWIKVFSSVAFTIFNIYLSPGDSYNLYYVEGINITKMILKDITNIKWIFSAGPDFDQTLLFNPYNKGYFSSESNYLVTKLVSVLAFISFGRYMIINLIFSLIAFSGAWKLYRFFYEEYPHLHKKLAIAILYLPSFVFWTSGILKDSLCIGMLGWMTYSIYKALYIRKAIVKNLVIAVITGYILGIVKSYILLSYLPFLFLFLLFAHISLIKRKIFKVMAFSVFVISGPLMLYMIADKLKEELGQMALDKLTESVIAQQSTFMNMADQAESSFSLGVEFDGSMASLGKMAPAALTATLYRPYLWESKKISTLMSSLESLALMLFTLYAFIKADPFHFIITIFKDPMVLFCFFFSIVFALFVGSTTLNFGTLVRYKIPCMPFYIIALVLILEISKKRKIAWKLNRQLNKQIALTEKA